MLDTLVFADNFGPPLGGLGHVLRLVPVAVKLRSFCDWASPVPGHAVGATGICPKPMGFAEFPIGYLIFPGPLCWFMLYRTDGQQVSRQGH